MVRIEDNLKKKIGKQLENLIIQTYFNEEDLQKSRHIQLSNSTQIAAQKYSQRSNLNIKTILTRIREYYKGNLRISLNLDEKTVKKGLLNLADFYSFLEIDENCKLVELTKEINFSFEYPVDLSLNCKVIIKYDRRERGKLNDEQIHCLEKLASQMILENREKN